MVPKTLQWNNLLWALLPIAKEKWNGIKWKISATLAWWERFRKAVSNTEYCYSRCWNSWTRSCIGTLFWQRRNIGAGTCEFPCSVWGNNKQEEKGVCVTSKKCNVNKPTYIQILLFTAKDNENLKHVVFVNYTLKDFKELAQALWDLLFVENCNVQ